MSENSKTEIAVDAELERQLANRTQERDDARASIAGDNDVGGCAKCPMSHEPVVGISTNGSCCLAKMRYFDERDFVGHETTAIPARVPDWCPLRKGPVTLKLKEGA